MYQQTFEISLQGMHSTMATVVMRASSERIEAAAHIPLRLVDSRMVHPMITKTQDNLRIRFGPFHASTQGCCDMIPFERQVGSISSRSLARSVEGRDLQDCKVAPHARCNIFCVILCLSLPIRSLFCHISLRISRSSSFNCKEIWCIR